MELNKSNQTTIINKLLEEFFQFRNEGKIQRKILYPNAINSRGKISKQTPTCVFSY